MIEFFEVACNDELMQEEWVAAGSIGELASEIARFRWPHCSAEKCFDLTVVETFDFDAALRSTACDRLERGLCALVREAGVAARCQNQNLRLDDLRLDESEQAERVGVRAV